MRKKYGIPGVGVLSKKYQDWVFKRPRSLKNFYLLFAVSDSLLFRWGIRVSVTADSHIKLTDSGGDEILLARKSRVPLYKNGVKKRVGIVAKSYFAEYVDLADGDVVIDVGANVGELGLYFGYMVNPRLICFEPERKEHECLVKNLPENAVCFNYGLWDSDTQLEFFDRNDTADSSVFRCDSSEKGYSVEVKRLDSVMKSFPDINRIKILKIDGEGAEPEILYGAADIIQNVKYISVDVGPERHGKQSTLVEVFNFLTDHQFRLVRFNEKRVTALFKNNLLDYDDE